MTYSKNYPLSWTNITGSNASNELLILTNIPNLFNSDFKFTTKLENEH